MGHKASEPGEDIHEVALLMMYYGSYDNRRFPHCLRALRPEVDEYGMPVYDENGEPAYSVIPLEVCEMNSEGYPIRDSSGKFITRTVQKICWGYRTSTGGIKDSGQMFETSFKIACPKFITDLPQGTLLELKDDTHTWRAIVQKCTSYQWGSDIWYEIPGDNEKVQ